MEWQPIETAPLDTPILLYGFWGWYETLDLAVQVGVGSLNKGDMEDDKICWQSITFNPYCDEGKPTHWMPLPEPPVAETEDT